MGHFGRLAIVVAIAGIELVDQTIVDFTEEDFDRLFSVNTKGAFFTLQAAAKHVADNGHIIYVGSSNTRFPRPGFGLYGGSKLAPQFLVEVLAKEIGARGITVNSILPSATEGAGVSTKEVRPQVREFIKNDNPKIAPRVCTFRDHSPSPAIICELDQSKSLMSTVDCPPSTSTARPQVLVNGCPRQ